MSQANKAFAEGGVVQPPSQMPLMRSMALPDLIQYALNLDPDNELLRLLSEKVHQFETSAPPLRRIESDLEDLHADLALLLTQVRALREGT